MTSLALFPPIEARNSGYLQVSTLHKIYWEEAGNPAGVPVIFLHGGPGAGIASVHRRFFDPNFYRIILFDQRGAGKSEPTAECRDNTTQDLINDIEKLRQYLGITKWLIFGGSWGSTLGLAYGEEYPNRCLGFVLRGIFLGQKWEIDWFIGGMGTFFPEAQRKFLGLLSEQERLNPLLSYSKRLNDPNPSIYYEAATAWSHYEHACSTLKELEDQETFSSNLDEMLSLARLEAHYFTHQNFLAENALIQNIGRIIEKTCVIIQGRYDVVCPIFSADKLSRSWPGARYEIIQAAGHSALEPKITDALVSATEYMKSELAVSI